MRVALLVERLQAGDSDRTGDGRLVAGDDRTVEVAEPSSNGLDHHRALLSLG
jgi:hypothetical protein